MAFAQAAGAAGSLARGIDPYGTPPAEKAQSAFRAAEKRFKAVREDRNGPRHERRRRRQEAEEKQRQLALACADVVDFKAIHEQHGNSSDAPRVGPGGEPLPQVRLVHGDCGTGAKAVYTLPSHPGLFFLLEALSVEEQAALVRETLLEYIEPPNRTNHSDFHAPTPHLWEAFCRSMDAEQPQLHARPDVDPATCSCGATPVLLPLQLGRSPSAAELEGGSAAGADRERLHLWPSAIPPPDLLLRRLRWATLGVQFDWAQRNYDPSLPHKPIPQHLAELASRLARPSLTPSKTFTAQAAIVNIYHHGDTLGGHVDDMEEDHSLPIVSISLGCKAIFLLGGLTREESPVAIMLRSGDVVLMSGHARRCFHGVPCIFTSPETRDVPTALIACAKNRARPEGSFKPPEGSCTLDMSTSHYTGGELDPLMAEFLSTVRINVNIRQVYK